MSVFFYRAELALAAAWSRLLRPSSTRPCLARSPPPNRRRDGLRRGEKALATGSLRRRLEDFSVWAALSSHAAHVGIVAAYPMSGLADQQPRSPACDRPRSGGDQATTP